MIPATATMHKRARCNRSRSLGLACHGTARPAHPRPQGQARQGEITGDRGFHNALQGASDRPGRTALGAAILAALAALFVAGGDDVIAVIFGANFRTLVWILRGCFLLLTPAVALATYYLCRRRRRRAGNEKDTVPEAGAAPAP